MDYQDSNSEQSDEATMMGPDASSSGGYPREIFTIKNWGDALAHHEDGPANARGPLIPAGGNGQPHVDTTPLTLIKPL